MIDSDSLVFVDMDGVLCDFVGAVLTIYGENKDDLLPTLKGEYDLAKVLGISKSRLWADIDGIPTFWSTLKKTPEASELMSYLTTKVPIGNMYILSAPSFHPNSFSGKKEWIDTHFPQYSDRLIITRHKELLAGKNRFLIDDSIANISRFIDSGGNAILFPRHWNDNFSYADKPTSFVKNALNEWT